MPCGFLIDGSCFLKLKLIATVVKFLWWCRTVWSYLRVTVCLSFSLTGPVLNIFTPERSRGAGGCN